jgi:hypothetical protein
MKSLAPLFLALAACSSPHAFRQPATVTLFGERPGLETWDAEAAAGRHLHPKEGSSCDVLTRTLQTGGDVLARATEQPAVTGAAAAMSGLVHIMISQSHGAPYGGPARITLALRHYPEGQKEADRGLFVVTPELAPDEAERTFRDAEISAEFHEPVLSVNASLESGRVRVRRRGADRLEFELFLVLKPAGGGARLQVVTRAEATVAR